MTGHVVAFNAGLEIEALARAAAAERLGVEERPCAECLGCGCRLYPSDLRSMNDGIPCSPTCPAADQLEELFP